MSIAFLLLGETTVAFYDATAAQRISETPPPTGAMGGLTDVAEFFGAPADSADIQALFTIDVSVSENHSSTYDIQQHPIEDGSEIADHIIVKPKRLTIEGVITDTPSGIGALLIVPGLIDRFSGSPRSIESFKTIQNYLDGKQLFDVVTGLKVYKNMAVRSFNVPRRAMFGRGLNFTMELNELQIVTGAVVASSLDGAGPDSQIGAAVPSVVD